MKKQRGSAILIAIFLVAAIGGIAFSFGKIFLLETDTASTVENGVNAYYAAESGIEEGMLRYRFDKNAEVPFKLWKIGEAKAFRANLTSGSVNTHGISYDGVSKSTAITLKNNQFYDLRMGFIGTFGKPFYGQDTRHSNRLDDFIFSQASPNIYGSSDPIHDFSSLLVPKDETYKINLDSLQIAQNLNDRDLTLYADFVQPDSTKPVPTNVDSIMYAKLTVDRDGDGKNVKEYKTFISSNPSGSCSQKLGNVAGCQNDLFTSFYLSSSIARSQAWQVGGLIGNFITKVRAETPLPLSKVTLSLRPLFNDAYIGLSTRFCLSNDCTNPARDRTLIAPGPFTTISSTGYYDGATRTLEANIDRQSGTLYDLFDYVILEKQ